MISLTIKKRLISQDSREPKRQGKKGWISSVNRHFEARKPLTEVLDPLERVQYVSRWWRTNIWFRDHFPSASLKGPTLSQIKRRFHLIEYWRGKLMGKRSCP
eukprot:TRINITY_DN70329_c0_g1_i1.p1 TRINITY_DN70329_c0_g1~~TRINITY_DN70329_c0_g1_i1.p1  ORF type:complete len:102 (+),score=7.73 TRINITY_DN70329_c0_g1_i1:898-1203(+)